MPNATKIENCGRDGFQVECLVKVNCSHSNYINYGREKKPLETHSKSTHTQYLIEESPRKNLKTHNRN